MKTIKVSETTYRAIAAAPPRASVSRPVRANPERLEQPAQGVTA